MAEFLRARRARLTPRDVGLPDGQRRRLPGLRRQEVAQLAAVSIDWYTRLEQGRAGAPGAAVLDALAQALLLSEQERQHLHLIARGDSPTPRHRAGPVRASLRAMLAGMPLLPAYVIDFRFDVLARNEAAAAVLGADFGSGAAANAARLLFLEPSTRRTQLDWAGVARETVGNLRANLARHGDDARLRELISDLRRDSPDFAGWWQQQTVQELSHGRKRIRHPNGCELTVYYDALDMHDDSDQCLIVLTPADHETERNLRVIVGHHSKQLTQPAIVA